MPRAMAVTRMTPRMARLAPRTGEVARQRREFPLAHGNRDAQLLEVLLERLAAEIDPAVLEEAVDVRLELGGGQPDDTFGHAPQSVLGIEPVHGVPLLLDEVPGRLARVRKHEHGADDEGGVLGANVAVDGAGERLLDEGRLSEGGQRVEVALLFLRRARRPEALEELVIAALVTDVGEDSDERRQDVGIDRGGAALVTGVELGGPRLDL